MTGLRIAVWQGHSPAGDSEAGIDSIRAPLAAAAAMDAAVLVLPEVWLPGYNCPDIASRADPAWPERAATLCRAAGCGLVLGYAEREGDLLYNSAIALSADGRTLAHYRKIQLYGPREKTLYTPGDHYVIFDLMGRKTALMICYDIEFAPHVAALAAQGVDLILVPTANMQPFTHVAQHTVPAMAANYGVSIAYANYCGVEEDLTYVGGSLITGPHGEVLAKGGNHPALLLAEIPARDPGRLSTQITDLRMV